jgi:hypothetical protein
VSVADRSPLLSYLANANVMGRWNDEDFSLLLAEARACGLLERLAHRLLNSRQVDLCSTHLKDQLLAATIHASGFRQDVGRELRHIERSLASVNAPVILLKGASYVLMNFPAANGRIFSDIDILVPKDAIAETEAALMMGGWATGKLDAYDQRYYREWSHEIPPMTHLQRGTTIDLHHSLVMPSCRIQVDSTRMIAAAKPVVDGEFWWRLQDEDVVLHAASHLMLNSEFDRGLRDLWDIDLLYRRFSASTPDFPLRLLARAQEVGLERILWQALRLTSTLFSTPLPEGMPKGQKRLFFSLVTRAASTRHPSTKPWGQGGADSILLLREMYLRLPNTLLAVHLWHKMMDLLSNPKQESI